MRFGKMLGLVGALIMGFAVAAPSANAGQVIYSTTGTFGGGGASVTVSDSTLTFVGQAPTLVTTTDSVPETINLGNFTLTSVNGVFDNFNTTFSLTITQIFPGLGNAAYSSTVLGTVRGIPAGGGGVGGIEIKFGMPNPQSIPGPVGPILYEVDEKTFIAGGTLTFRNLNGQVTTPPGSPVVPLPTSAYAGIGLFAVLGAARLRKSRMAA